MTGPPVTWTLPTVADIPLSGTTGPRPVRPPVDAADALAGPDSGGVGGVAVARPASARSASARPAPARLAVARPAAVRPPTQLIDRGIPPAAVDELHPALAVTVRAAAPDLPRADLEHAVLAAAPLVAAPGVDDPAVVAAGIGATAAAMSRLAVPPAATQPVDWSRFGVVVPVLAGSAGAGASVLAAAVTDALQLAGRRVLLVDAADPARSGLAAAAPEEGLRARQVHPGLHLRYSWRHESLLARMESRYPITPAMVPPPPAWLPDRGPVHVTVVDIGHDGWRAAADPLLGAGGWLRRGQPAGLPLLVVRPTRPSLQQAEQVLARLYRWVSAGVAESPGQLVVVGARRWPRGVTGAAGRLLEPLLGGAVFLPRHRGVETGGITADLLPRPLTAALAPLLQDLQLIDYPRKGRR
jgi:hypothetical protein